MRPRPAPDLLGRALRDAGAVLRRPAWALAAAANDPLQLPPASVPGVSAWRPSAEALSAYAALYLHAQLDEAGVLPTVDLLATQRYELVLREPATLQRLERFAAAARDHPSAADRARWAAHLFGQGAERSGPGADAQPPERSDFNQRLLRLASAIVRADAGRTRDGGTGLAAATSWRLAVQALQALVAAVPAASLLVWARRIHGRTLAAFAVLGDAGLQRQLHTTTPWQTLLALVGGSAEESAARDASARRGAAGQTLLRSLDNTPSDAAAWARTAPPTALVQAALSWLAASGLVLPESMPPAMVTTPMPPMPPMPRSAWGAAALRAQAVPA